MINPGRARQIISFLLTVTVMVCGVSQASANAIFDATAKVNVNIFRVADLDANVFLSEIPQDLAVTGGTAVIDLDVLTDGIGASATTDLTDVTPDVADPRLEPGSLVPIGLDQGLSLNARTFGIVSGENEDSEASSLAFTEGLLVLENNGDENTGSNLLVVLEVSWEWDVSATVNDPSRESAHADMALQITNESELISLDLAEEIFSNGSGATLGDDHRQIIALGVGPGQSDSVRLIANVRGSASALVPEPATAALLGLMFAVTASPAMSRRRRRA